MHDIAQPKEQDTQMSTRRGEQPPARRSGQQNTQQDTQQDIHYVKTFPSPVGDLTFVSDGEHLTGLYLENQRYFMENVVGELKSPQSSRETFNLVIFSDTQRWLKLYFEGKNPGMLPPIKMNGTPFRQRVWELLLEIPYGELVTYGELAAKLAAEKGVEKMSSRAVGGAVGHNPISILVPCHRVIGANNNLTGYGGGIDRKIQLLELEGVDVSGLKVPNPS
ncbi:MAG: methylated-DNA--[protein]-cysteine S-methyltransferase [Eggerthellaceae bacterium]|nr:methylated-DNA--[protein]-cysteine S-methyltransferase [Eggerthellaceae bacterium]